MLEHDEKYMQRCITLAARGKYTVKSGALVGCVITKNEQIVAEGWHQYPGQAHAEVVALENAGEKAKSATLYVSLEPCAHWGKTGPCCDAVIAAGITRVVFGMIDPNPLVAGKGLEKIKVAGIEIVGPILADACAELNPGFIKRITQGLPYVRCKLAMSLDGRTAMASGESKWITGPQARAEVQELRATSAVVMTGIGTILADDPSLNVRLASVDKKPELTQTLRLVVDAQLKTPAHARILQLEGKVLLATAMKEDSPTVSKFSTAIASAAANSQFAAELELKSFPESALTSKGVGVGQVDLLAVMQFLAQELECNDVLLEAGASLAGAMLADGLIDEVITYVAPKLLGSDALPLFRLPGMETMAQQIQLEFIEMVRVGADCKIRSRVLKPTS